METPQSEPERRRRDDLQLVNADPECLGEIMTEYPFLQERYEHFRDGRRTSRSKVRLWWTGGAAQAALYRESEDAYTLNTGESMHAWQRRLLARYSRNLALIQTELTASLF